MGKTTFLRCLQGQQAPATKNINVSTNGVDIAQVELPLFVNEVIGIWFLLSHCKFTFYLISFRVNCRNWVEEKRRLFATCGISEDKPCFTAPIDSSWLLLPFTSLFTIWLTSKATDDFNIVLLSSFSSFSSFLLITPPLIQYSHWMQQINSIVDNPGNSMPILIVGTHADKLTPHEQEVVLQKIVKVYPVSLKPTGVQGHFCVSHRYIF